MKLLKIIGFIFLIYFVRRLIQMYKVMNQLQRDQENLRQRQQAEQRSPSGQPFKNSDVIEADFKVVDKN